MSAVLMSSLIIVSAQSGNGQT